MDNKIYNVLKRHKEYLRSSIEWQKFSENNKDLPTIEQILSEYESWKQVREVFQIGPTKSHYSTEELLNIARLHIDKFTSTRIWDEYADIYGLPKSITYIKHKSFGSWTEVKKHLQISSNPNEEDDRIKKEMIEILKKHGEHYISRKKWDEYAKEHSLPTFKTIRKYVTYEELKRYVSSSRYSDEELVKIAREHIEYFTSMSKWDEYAREHGLPNATTFYRKFGSWKMAKVEVFKQY